MTLPTWHPYPSPDTRLLCEVCPGAISQASNLLAPGRGPAVKGLKIPDVTIDTGIVGDRMTRRTGLETDPSGDLDLDPLSLPGPQPRHGRNLPPRSFNLEELYASPQRVYLHRSVPSYPSSKPIGYRKL